MKTPLSVKLREIPVVSSTADRYLIDEAAETLDNHEHEISKLEERLRASEIRYQNLFKSREAILQNMRAGIALAVLTTTILAIISYYFI